MEKFFAVEQLSKDCFTGNHEEWAGGGIESVTRGFQTESGFCNHFHNNDLWLLLCAVMQKKGNLAVSQYIKFAFFCAMLNGYMAK